MSFCGQWLSNWKIQFCSWRMHSWRMYRMKMSYVKDIAQHPKRIRKILLAPRTWPLPHECLERLSVPFRVQLQVLMSCSDARRLVDQAWWVAPMAIFFLYWHRIHLSATRGEDMKINALCCCSHAVYELILCKVIVRLELKDPKKSLLQLAGGRV